MRNDITSTRSINAVESFKNASECIGPITHGKRLFAITRGQWSMIDAVLYCLDQVKKANISIWTWTIAAYEVDVLTRLMIDKRITTGTLVIDAGAREKNQHIISNWQKIFGSNSVRYVLNHAKIATLENEQYKLLLRGSMNLNFNPRFEQFDLTEGQEDFALVKQIESELPILPDDCSGTQVYKASQVSKAFNVEQLEIFKHIKTWAK